MKKFEIFYVIIIIICIIMIWTKGFDWSIGINSEENGPEGIQFVVHDFITSREYLLIGNCIISSIIIISMIFMTLNKNNKIKIKWVLFIIITMSVLFIPLGENITSGGLYGITNQEYRYLWNISSLFNR